MSAPVITPKLLEQVPNAPAAGIGALTHLLFEFPQTSKISLLAVGQRGWIVRTGVRDRSGGRRGTVREVGKDEKAGKFL